MRGQPANPLPLLRFVEMVWVVRPILELRVIIGEAELVNSLRTLGEMVIVVVHMVGVTEEIMEEMVRVIEEEGGEAEEVVDLAVDTKGTEILRKEAMILEAVTLDLELIAVAVVAVAVAGVVATNLLLMMLRVLQFQAHSPEILRISVISFIFFFSFTVFSFIHSACDWYGAMGYYFDSVSVLGKRMVFKLWLSLDLFCIFIYV